MPPSPALKMMCGWAVLLFVGGVVSAPTQPSPHSYEQVVALAVNIYNQKQKPEFAFRLLEMEPQTDWDPVAKTTQLLKFSIKETTCRSAENMDISQCEFKPDGVDRDCSGFYSSEQNPPTIIVQCEDANQTLNRITRGRFWRKVKRFCKKHCFSIALGALKFG